ncbi:hypothetical protein GCM10010282_37610 [Streptomyces roseolus]|nr:hypothetical protein GCM10010282_37610 [Streptomyces roseolus]
MPAVGEDLAALRHPPALDHRTAYRAAPAEREEDQALGAPEADRRARTTELDSLRGGATVTQAEHALDHADTTVAALPAFGVDTDGVHTAGPSRPTTLPGTTPLTQAGPTYARSTRSGPSPSAPSSPAPDSLFGRACPRARFQPGVGGGSGSSARHAVEGACPRGSRYGHVFRR